LGDRASSADIARAFRERAGAGRADVRLQAVQSLAALADVSAASLLRGALDDDDLRVRLAAREALLRVLPDAGAAGLPPADSLRRDVRPVHRAAAQPPVVARSRARQLLLATDRGEILIDMLSEQAPQTVESFAALAARGFFDGLTFHRVVPNFVVQGGDPLGSGWGDAGYTLRCEYSPLRYEGGVVGVAHSGKDTGGCQLFVTQSDQPHLNARYTIFGRVVQGMEVIERIQIGDRFTARVLGDDAAP
jgi:cyclophilin family peptidyl-prolyl cis-trans isomerase